MRSQRIRRCRRRSADAAARQQRASLSLVHAGPYVTAANAAWRLTGEPIYYAGRLYYPTGPTEYFDGEVMARTGMYEGVPVYQNRTLEPYSMVFVPIGGNLMRPYELKREGRLVGTIGSRTPSFPIQRDAELATTLPGYDIGLADLDRLRRSSTSQRAQWDWASPSRKSKPRRWRRCRRVRRRSRRPPSSAPYRRATRRMPAPIYCSKTRASSRREGRSRQ